MRSSSRPIYISVIFGIIIMFSLVSGIPFSHGSNKPLTAGVNETGTIVITEPNKSNRTSFEKAPAQKEDSCGEILCMDLYPKDRKIEGEHISTLNPAGVNSFGQIVGLCVLDDPERNYPFVREPNGNMWLFRTPSSTGQGEFTDISDTGYAVGIYAKDSSKIKVGFLMNSKRQWVTDITYPSNSCPSSRSYLHTQPNGINDEGEIVGNVDCTEHPDDKTDPLSRGNGFYRAPDGTFYRVQYENASRTVAGKISNLGVIVGYYVVDNDTWIPFAARKDEVIKPLIP
jgi:hypothetical protein